METLLVYADFEWFNEPTLVGTLSYERLRGSDTYGFKFDNEWLRCHGDLFLCADLNNFVGWQYAAAGHDVFGMISDALPDRWGRTLILRREQIAATEEKRPVRRLSSFDYLTGIDDMGRMGALRFKRKENDSFINADTELRVPPVTELKALVRASDMVEQSEQQNLLPDKRWVAQLLQPGSSLGGARPKANVVDERGVMYVAKFPSRNDDYDVALWEHWAHTMARKAGVNVAETQVINVDARHHALLSKRFDRQEDGRRIHFASAMSLLGLSDGCNASTGHGYLDIVDFILAHATDVERNLQELYRRVAFNICIGNSDDHFRNHGFLLTPRGWTLSPAYDLNPTTHSLQSLLVTASSSEASLGMLLSANESYMIPKAKAQQIVEEVVVALHDWQRTALSLSIPMREINLFANRIIASL